MMLSNSPYFFFYVLLFSSRQDAVVLASDMLLRTGYDFNYPEPDPALVFQLGAHPDTHVARDLTVEPKLLPLYPGYNIIFAYLYVGTPAQRQAVLVDTTSEWTVFPCTGCKRCGDHINPYFDPQKSDSYQKDVCYNGKKEVIDCTITYALEDNKYEAILGHDNMFIAGNDVSDVPGAEEYEFDVNFGCMTSASGVFTHISPNGLLGLGYQKQTLSGQFSRKEKIPDVFALCFRSGGGIFTLGGVDSRIHKKHAVSKYAKMSEKASETGLWTVNIKNCYLRAPGDATGTVYELNLPETKLNNIMNGDRGAIIASSFSISSFPAALTSSFGAAFYKASGIHFSKKPVTLSKEEVASLPDVVFELEDASSPSKTIEVVLTAESYLDSAPNVRDVYMISLDTHPSNGFIFGADFFEGKNVVFDARQKIIGFTPSECRYEHYDNVPTANPTARPTKQVEIDKDPVPDDDEACPSGGALVPVDECTARCDNTAKSAPYFAEGIQTWTDRCDPPKQKQIRKCHMACSANSKEIVTQYKQLSCPMIPWSECNKKCVQSKKNQVYSTKSKKCEVSGVTTRPCYASACPVSEGDYLIFVDMKVYSVSPWSSVDSEDYFEALASVLRIDAGNIEVLVDSGADVFFKKIQIQIRLRAKDYERVFDTMLAGQAIVDRVNEDSFAGALVASLNKTSTMQDSLDYSKYGWLLPNFDLVVESATGFPVSSKKVNPEESGSYDSSASSNTSHQQLELLLIGVALAGVVIASVLGCLYCRLRSEYDSLQKDKGISLREMWNRYKAGKRFKGTRGENYKKVRTQEMTQMVGGPEDEDEFDGALDFADDVNG